MRPVYLVVGEKRRVLGQVNPDNAGELPELLRYVADYYDDNPDDCAELVVPGVEWKEGPAYLLDPFGGVSAVL